MSFAQPVTRLNVSALPSRPNPAIIYVLPDGREFLGARELGSGAALTPVQKFASKVLGLAHRGFDPQFREFANYPPNWAAAQYRKGKVVGNHATTPTGMWLAVDNGTAASAAAPSHTSALCVPDNTHNWMYMGPITADRLSKKTTIMDTSGARLNPTIVVQSGGTFPTTTFGGTILWDRYTTTSTVKMRDLVEPLGALSLSEFGGVQGITYRANGERLGAGDCALAFYTDSPRVAVQCTRSSTGRVVIDDVDMVFSTEQLADDGNQHWWDINPGWATVRKIVLVGCNNLKEIAVLKGYRVWPAKDANAVRGAYAGDSTAAGGGPSPGRQNDSWQPSVFKLLAGQEASIRMAAGGTGYVYGDSVGSANMLNRLKLSAAQFDTRLGGAEMDYLWCDQTSWDLPGSGVSTAQFTDAIDEMFETWLAYQPNAVIIASTYRGDGTTTNQAYVNAFKQRVNLISKDRILLIDPFNKAPLPYYTPDSLKVWVTEDGYRDSSNNADLAHQSQLGSWMKAREAAQDLRVEMLKAVSGVSRGYGA